MSASGAAANGKGSQILPPRTSSSGPGTKYPQFVQPEAPRKVRTTQPRGYTPNDSRDVTAEIAAMNARGRNGSGSAATTVSEGMATENLRSHLPRPAMPPTGSEALAAALREQDAATEAREADKLRRAQDEYKRFLVSRKVELADDDGEEVRINDDGRVERLYDDAYADAETLRTIAPVAPTTISAPAPIDRERTLLSSAPPTAMTPALDVRSRAVSLADVDRLWDWIRSDADGENFLGRTFDNSQALHAHAAAINAQSPLRAIDVNSRHEGFFLLTPIISGVAMLHAHLSPTARGHFLDLFPYILTGARQIVGDAIAIGFYNRRLDERAARFFERFSFTPYTVFVQKGTGQ